MFSLVLQKGHQVARQNQHQANNPSDQSHTGRQHPSRVDPLGATSEINEANNVATQDTLVQTGGASLSAFNQLTISKAQTDPVPPSAVATNGILRYTLTIGNDGTDPVSNIVVKDFLPSGSRFIAAADTDSGLGTADACFCTHDGAATGGVITCIGGDRSGTVNTMPDAGGVGDGGSDGSTSSARTPRSPRFRECTPRL